MPTSIGKPRPANEQQSPARVYLGSSWYTDIRKKSGETPEVFHIEIEAEMR
jgi:hypothetical protein